MAKGFKRALIGFHRGDVLEYIKDLSSNYAATLAKQEQRIKELLQENAALKKKLDGAGKDIIQGEHHANQ